MYRYRLTIEYDGTPFVGWQRQKSGLAVQEVLESAVYKYCQINAIVTAAGRTDAGVHATGQVVHVDLPRDASPYQVINALNFHIKPHPVAVVAARRVDNDFHARFSAIGRGYVYRILNRRAPAVLMRDRVWWVSKPLDSNQMAQGASFLLGRHDFTSFRASECQSASPIKNLDVLDVMRCGDEIIITAKARSFLHHQVRNMVGTLALVGEGKWQPEDIRRVLEARDRSVAGPTAPPSGLYLTDVVYPTS